MFWEKNVFYQVPDTECTEREGPKPLSREICKGSDCPAAWHVSHWSNVSSLQTFPKEMP